MSESAADRDRAEMRAHAGSGRASIEADQPCQVPRLEQRFAPRAAMTRPVLSRPNTGPNGSAKPLDRAGKPPPGQALVHPQPGSMTRSGRCRWCRD